MRRSSRVPGSQRNPDEILGGTFSQHMYDNMWSHINPEVMEDMYPGLQTFTKQDILDDIFKQKHHGQICFKGDPVRGGHYCFIDPEKGPVGTYECNLLKDKDDGMCHGAALAYYIDRQLIDAGKPPRYSLIRDPQSDDDFIFNYKQIFTLYDKILSTRWKQGSPLQQMNARSNVSCALRQLDKWQKYGRRGGQLLPFNHVEVAELCSDIVAENRKRKPRG